jgi:nitrate reductase NapAB chaperone NapD
MTKKEWSVSGLCITARPERLAEVEEMLNDRPGLEIYARDPQSGRLVAVQECATIEEHEQRLRQLQTLPGVLTADLVLHYNQPIAGKTPTKTGASE